MYNTIINGVLLRWYSQNKRNLPWRDIHDPYKTWLSEVMLQQTQVATVIPYFNRFIENNPDLKSLSRVQNKKLIKLWEGLGYYSRAKNLKKSAQIIYGEMNGKFPKTVKDLQNLPGIGRYTAGAISSIAFGLKAPILDGNVKRVLSRLFCINDNGATSAFENRLWEKADDLVPIRRPGDFNQALMELEET